MILSGSTQAPRPRRSSDWWSEEEERRVWGEWRRGVQEGSAGGKGHRLRMWN